MGTSKILIDGVGIDLTDDTVAANKMLLGTKAHDNNGDSVTGNIPSKSAETYTPNTIDQTIASGRYLNGAQTIKGDANLIAGNIASGVTIFGVNGTHAGQKPEQSKTVTPTASGFTVSPDSGKVLSSVIVGGDADLVAANVRKGKNIFGVDGSMEEGITPSGTISITQNGTGMDVSQYALADVSVPEKAKRWTVDVTADKSSSFVLMQDTWLAQHYNDNNLLIYVHPLFAIPTAACFAFSLAANFQLMQISGGASWCSIRGYHTDNSTSISAVHLARKVNSSMTTVGEIRVDFNGDLYLNGVSTYPVAAGKYEVVAVLV